MATDHGGQAVNGPAPDRERSKTLGQVLQTSLSSSDPGVLTQAPWDFAVSRDRRVTGGEAFRGLLWSTRRRL
jgi:hypothetical protein